MTLFGNVRRSKRLSDTSKVDDSITAETTRETFEGNPCERCGSRIRFASGKGIRNRCVRCYKQWRRDNEWRYYRKYGSALFRKLGLTVSRYYEMCEEQNWSCSICGTLPEKALHVDHCHKTNKIRGLLCGGCNVGLGHFKDDASRLERAIAYLKASA